jgi:hypothetical protein
MLYPDHRSTPWLTEGATPRSLEPIVRCPRGALNGTGPHVLAARIDPKSTVSKACRDITTALPPNLAQPTRAEARRGVRTTRTCARTKVLNETTWIEEALLEIDIGADIRYCGLGTALDQGHLTMRLSDAPAQRQTKMLYPDHRPPPWLTEDSTPRSLEPIVRRLR